MHKKLYASGFLYHSSSQQILLQQSTRLFPNLSIWSLFGNYHTEKEEPQAVFKNTIFDLLGIIVNVAHPVYSYFNEESKTNQFMFYSRLKKTRDFSPKNGFIFSWFSFKDVLKLYTTKQTKHDIIIGQRVINAALRKQRGEHSF